MNGWNNNYQFNQQQPTDFTPTNTFLPSSNKRLITPWADQYSEFSGMGQPINPATAFLWANENAKSYIFKSFHPITENSDMFFNENGCWYYTKIINGKKSYQRMFLITINEIRLLIEHNTNNIECLIINYSTPLLTDIAVIPYKEYIKKQLKDHFRIHQAFGFVANKNNIINEFLYMLISIHQEPVECLYNYPHQGWNHLRKYALMISLNQNLMSGSCLWICRGTVRNSR